MVTDERSADAARDLLLRHAEAVDEAAVRVRFLDRVELLALDVLDKRELEDAVVGNLTYDDRHLLEPGALGRAPAPFARNYLIFLALAANEERLNDAVGADRGRELLDLPFAEDRARLIRIGLDLVDVDLEQYIALLDRGWTSGEEGVNPPPERLSCHLPKPPWPGSDSSPHPVTVNHRVE